MLKELVEQQASGLVFLPGPSGRQAELAQSALADLMPVELDPDRARGNGYNMEGHLSLTTRGRDHLLTLLAASPDQNERVWAALPGFYWYAGVRRLRPGSEALAVHDQARNSAGRIPLIATRQAGNGKVLFMGIDSAWRWRRGVEDLYHYRFWGQVFRWMAHQRHLAYAEGIRFFLLPETPSRGDRIFLHATVLDRNGFPLDGAMVESVLRTPSGREERLTLLPDSGGWGTYSGQTILREGGKHALSISCRETGREVKMDLLVHHPIIEQVGQPARPEVLGEIAFISGGRAAGTEEAKKLIDELRALPQRRPREERLRLWCHPAWLALLAGVFSLYWIGRKAIGRI
jgi:hypothetical protein